MLPLRGYYAILDVSPDFSTASTLTWARALLAAGPCMLQVRAKSVSAAKLLELARALTVEARAAGVPLCVNDRLDVALLAGAQAVHLGQDDLPLRDARRVAAGRLAIGISTHDAEQVTRAIAAGADYIGFGPVFPTATKTDPDAVVGLAGLRAAVALAGQTPVVAIGGLSLADVADVADADAAAAAVIGAVARAPDPTAAGRLIGRAFDRVSSST